MNAKIETMFADAEGRYLSNEELQVLFGWTDSFEQRVQAMGAVEAVEDRIIDGVLEEIRQGHPNFFQEGYMAREKTSRDVVLVLRYCALAMVREDERFLSDKLLYWMRTVLQSFNFGELINTTYRALIRQTEAHVDPKHFRLIAPYLRLTHEVLTHTRS